MRRIDDRIRELCKQFLIEQDPEIFRRLAAELRAALHDHVQRLRARIESYPKVDERRSFDLPPSPKPMMPAGASPGKDNQAHHHGNNRPQR